MRIERIALIIVLMLLSPLAAAEHPNRITVLSYNIHHGEGMDRKFDLARIAEVIKSVSPDVVSVQEVDVKTKRSSGIDQAKELAKLTGMEGVFRASMEYQDGEYGNAILTKLPIVKSNSNPHLIPLPGEPRSALCVTVTKKLTDGTMVPFTFMATHLDTKAEPRIQSPPLIELFFKDKPETLAILAGDLNAIPKSPTMDLFRKGWIDATSQAGLLTVPVKTPKLQIDYVLCRPAGRWKVISAKVLDEAIASDHRPIMAVLEFVPVK